MRARPRGGRQVRQAARDGESGHIGAPKLKRGGAGRSLNGATVFTLRTTIFEGKLRACGTSDRRKTARLRSRIREKGLLPGSTSVTIVIKAAPKHQVGITL